MFDAVNERCYKLLNELILTLTRLLRFAPEWVFQLRDQPKMAMVDCALAYSSRLPNRHHRFIGEHDAAATRDGNIPRYKN